MALARKTLGLRRNLKEEERRDQIKTAAINLFSSRGYDQASLDDLVQEAGVSKSLLYWYWESKAALLRDLIDTCMLSYRELLQASVDSEEPYPEKMHRLLWDYLELFRKNEKLNKLVHFCSLHTGKRQPREDFGPQVDAHYRVCMDLLEALCRQGMEQGHVKKNRDPAAMALGLMSLIEGHIYLSILGDRFPLDRILTPVFNDFMSGA